MMKIEEVISQLKHLTLFCASVEDKTWGKLVQALDMTIEVLKKEIPKKIKIDIYSAFCPTCSKNLVGNRNCNYCHNCGQKIDWEE